jgi:hypothetical protein
MEKKAIAVIKPKLMTVMIETQINLRSIALVKGKDDFLTFNKKLLLKHTTDSSTASVCTRVV